MFLGYFSQLFDTFRRLECWKCSKRKKGVVKWVFLKLIMQYPKWDMSQTGTKNNKNPTFSNRESFLSKSRQTPYIGVLKTYIKGRIRCPVVFSEEIIAVFRMKNFSNCHQNWQKTKTFRFPNFSEISTDFVDWNKEKGPQWKLVLFSKLSEEMKTVFQMKNV